jgi:hypothetical protein
MASLVALESGRDGGDPCLPGCVLQWTREEDDRQPLASLVTLESGGEGSDPCLLGVSTRDEDDRVVWSDSCVFVASDAHNLPYAELIM